jgi:hypothetical protein
MKVKLLQLLTFLKSASLYLFKIIKRWAKVLTEETIIVLQHLDTFLGA